MDSKTIKSFIEQTSIEVQAKLAADPYHEAIAELRRLQVPRVPRPLWLWPSRP